MKTIHILFARITCAAMGLIAQNGVAYAQSSVELFKQTLDRPSSKIEFDVESNLLNASGAFSDYVAKLDLAPKDLAKSSLSFAMNMAEVGIDSGAPQVNFILQNLLASIPNPKITFNSSSVEVVSPSRLTISGPVHFNRQVKQISFVTNLSEASPTRSRFRGELTGQGFNPLSAQALQNNQGGFSGKVTFDLVFKKSLR